MTCGYGRRRQAVANIILKKYVVEKGSYSTKAARVVAAMSSFAQKGPSMEMVDSGVDAMLRRRGQQ